MNAMDRQKNELINSGASETQEIITNNSSSIKASYFSRVMRTKESLERDIMLGQVEGYKRQGRPRLCWIDSIKEITSLRLETLKETVKDRQKWRMLVEEKTRNSEGTNVK